MDRADSSLSDQVVPIGELEAIAVMKDVAIALQQLHAIGIIHRDLKPANILRHNGRWKLADFGIAHDEEIGSQGVTFKGWGTREYMRLSFWKGGRRLSRPTCMLWVALASNW